jgi:hypothetical protein
MQPTSAPTPRFAFGPRNFRLMWVGLAVLAVGFITMMLDGADYGEGFLGLTLGPILLFIGFIIEFAAILVPAAPVVAASIAAPTPVAPVARPATPAKPAYKRPG